MHPLIWIFKRLGCPKWFWQKFRHKKTGQVEPFLSLVCSKQGNRQTLAISMSLPKHSSNSPSLSKSAKQMVLEVTLPRISSVKRSMSGMERMMTRQMRSLIQTLKIKDTYNKKFPSDQLFCDNKYMLCTESWLDSNIHVYVGSHFRAFYRNLKIFKLTWEAHFLTCFEAEGVIWKIRP